MNVDTLYSHLLLDHYRYPRNQTLLVHPVIDVHNYNPSCGDSMLFQAHVAGGILTHIALRGQGCVISQATASLLGEYIMHKPVEKVAQLDKHVILELISLPLGPTRLRCALLALEAVQTGIAQYTYAQNREAL